MSIVFNEKPGILAEIKFSLFFIYNFEWFEAQMQNFEVKINKEFIKNINQLKKKVDCSKVYMKVLCSTEIYGGTDEALILTGLSNDKIWKMNSYDDLINTIKDLKEEEIKSSIIYELLVIKNRSNELKTVLKEEQEVIELIESLECSSSMKWNLVTFLNNIKKYMNEFVEFLEKYLKEYDKLVNKRIEEMKVFNYYIKKILKRVEENSLKVLQVVFGI